jgi:hypothetical protein
VTGKIVQIERLKNGDLLLTFDDDKKHLIEGPPGVNPGRRYKSVAAELERHLQIDKKLRSPIKDAWEIHEMWLDEQSATKSTREVAPPAFAELVISFLAPKNSVQSQLGDLQEMFRKNADRFGEKQARRIYWKQVARSIAPLLWQWLKRLGFFTVVLEYFRSKMGL